MKLSPNCDDDDLCNTFLNGETTQLDLFLKLAAV